MRYGLEVQKLPRKRGGEHQQTVGVVYLAWHALGCATFQRFADSYRRFLAGCEHELIVIYAGFEQQRDLEDAASVFQDIPHTRVEFADVKFDIGYYLETARRLTHEYLCFLNTYTEITSPNWLGYLHIHAARKHVGIVGAAGSYESLYDSFGLYQKLIWVCSVSGNKVDERAAYYFDFILRHNCPTAVVEPAIRLPPHGINRWRAQISNLIRECEQDSEFHAHWEKLTSPNMVFADFRRFPAFPNPHIRSSGFMVRRDRLLMHFEPSQIRTKLDACAFESGHESLTTLLRRAGLAAIVVANDGQGYDVPDWWRSGTFRLGNQPKLILTDNRSREFVAMPPGERSLHVRLTWGDYIGSAPPDFPDFGYAFAKGSLSPKPRRRVETRSLAFDPVYLICKVALRLMQPVAPKRTLRGDRPLLVRKVRSAVRWIVRGLLPPFRRLDERVATDARTIARLEAELVVLQERVSSLESKKTAHCRGADLQLLPSSNNPSN